MLARILALFIILPAVEAFLFIQVDKLIGLWPTIGLILFTGVLGGYLAKREGLATWKRLNGKMSQGGLPTKELLNGVIILVAGALLVTPGVLTDFVGFMGLIPPTRALIRKGILKYAKRKMKDGSLELGFFGGGFGDKGAASWDAYEGYGSYGDDPYGDGSRGPRRDEWRGERRSSPEGIEAPSRTQGEKAEDAADAPASEAPGEASASGGDGRRDGAGQVEETPEAGPRGEERDAV